MFFPLTLIWIPLNIKGAIFESLCVNWLMGRGGGGHVTDLDVFLFYHFCFFLSILTLLLPLLSQVAVSGQPCTQHIGVSNKTDDINGGMHTCTCVQAHPFTHAHIPSLIPKLPITMTWEMCASVQQLPGNNTNPLCSCRHSFFPLSPLLYLHCSPSAPPLPLPDTPCATSLFILLLEHSIIPLSQEGTCKKQVPTILGASR